MFSRLGSLFRRAPAAAGGKESAMADPIKPETPAGQQSGVDQEAMQKAVNAAVQAAVQDAVAQAVKPLAEQVAAQAKPITADDVAKLVGEQFKSRDQAAAKAAGKKALIDKITKEKLGGDADLAALLPDTEDEAALSKAADTLAAKTKPKGDFGGADKGGGSLPGPGSPAPANPHLSPGVAKFADSIKLPK